MAFRLIDTAWSVELTGALRHDTSALRIICPFIKLGALERLLELRPQAVQVITRFNLDDFAKGVSDIASLRRLLAIGGQVRGIKNLHAKLYLFGSSQVIVTSANLTETALDHNHEFGAIADDAVSIDACRGYFDRLWELAGADLIPNQLADWDEKVMGFRASGGNSGGRTSLGDFGAEAGIGVPPPVKMPVVVADARQAFVKFLGNAEDRVLSTTEIVKLLVDSGCHRVVAYPAQRRPRSVREDAVMFIARLTEEPNDIRIFGRAIGMEYVAGRDDATQEDIALRRWRRDWPHYIRLHQTEFVAGKLVNGVSLNELMDELGANAFAATKRNAAAGHGNTNPRRAYRQQAAVELSAEGLAWLSERLQSAFDTYGTVPREVFDRLD